jgi:hypothetical protein
LKVFAMKSRSLTIFLVAVTAVGLSSCKTLFHKAVPSQRVRVERLVVTGQYPEGKDYYEAWVMVGGYKSGADAELLPPRQWLDGYRVHIEQLERPVSVEAMSESLTPFTRSLPIDLSKLRPGFYIVNVNGMEKRLEIPEPPEPEIEPAEATVQPLSPAQ